MARQEGVEVAAPVPVEAALGVEVAAPVPVEAALGDVVAAPAPVEIWSLRAAHVYAVTLLDGAHVHVNAIDLQHTAALELVLEQQLIAREWVVPDLYRVSNPAAVDHLIELGIHAHLSIIVDHPHHPTYLDAFREWTWWLQTTAWEVGAARVAGGENFYTRVKKLCQVARKVVGAGHTRKKSDIWIGTKLHEIRDMMVAVKGDVVFLV